MTTAEDGPRESDFNEYVRQFRLSFLEAMKEHYRRVYRITERQKCCLNPAYPKDEVANEIAEWSLSTLSPLSVATPPGGGTVLDVGCGAGADCFLAAQMLGTEGRAIGVDPLEEHIVKARELKKRYRYENVQFHVGSDQRLPCSDQTVDLVIVNFAFHLFRDYQQSLREMYRVLRHSGQIVLADCWDRTPIAYEDNPEQWFYSGGGGLSLCDVRSAIEATDLEFIDSVSEKKRHPGDSDMLGYAIVCKPGSMHSLQRPHPP